MARDPRDPESDLTQSWLEIEAQYRHDLDARLIHRLNAVMARRVPLRGVGRGPAAVGARLHFADGTTVIAHSPQGGAMGRMAVALQRRATVLLDRVVPTDAGVEVELRWSGEHALLAVVTGFDQTD